jgi:hypothetical protein
MIRHAGNLLHKISSPSGLNPIKEAAAANLAYKFGWAPLIEDLGKLLNFADAARSQQRNIEKAYSSKGVRRRVELGTDTGSASGRIYVWSKYGYLLDPRWNASCTSRTWATVRWIVRDPSLYGYKPTFQEGMRTSLGLNAGHVPIAIWKALPWSWMIDWFTDISNVMQANYNSIYFKPYRLSVMRTSKTTIIHEGKTFSSARFLTKGTKVVTYKYRHVNDNPSASPTLRLPFMDGYKLSVLGSLTALKVLK